MTDYETCKSVRNLIPRYHNGQCTETERMFIEDPCARCQDCRDLLLRPQKDVEDESVKKLLYVSNLQGHELFGKPAALR